MTADFIKGRSIPNMNMDNSKINDLLCMVYIFFGKEFLEEDGENRIQKLWKRKDALATNQLVILGNALNVFATSHSKWLKERIKDIKLEKKEDHKGDIFEIIALSMFSIGGQGVEPTKEDAPGIDGIVTCRGGAKCVLSLKDFGSSRHKRYFNLKAKAIERVISQYDFKKNNKNGAHIVIKNNKFPTETDWKQIERKLPEYLDEYFSGKPISIKNWSINVIDIDQLYSNISSKKRSYSFFMSVPCHKNEQKNIESKIEDACENISRHSNNISDDFLRLLLIRVPEETDVMSCVQCVEQWIELRPTASVDVVFFYQPTVAQDKNTGSYIIVHCILNASGKEFATNHRFPTWLKKFGDKNFPIVARSEVGMWTVVPEKITYLDGSDALDHYHYQRGLIYETPKKNADGSFYGEISNPIPGIQIFQLFDLGDGNEDLIIKGNFPEGSDMELFQ
ncbi:hypothetical protein [Komagataeibacter europaeus]|uniref:hypothetical protein n=1 Tax=Komagataeibacter europaeus TaxID=33995 RepID=UPI00031C3F2A|nr:hypothetical protein [Komagataeibacter europaeus]